VELVLVVVVVVYSHSPHVTQTAYVHIVAHPIVSAFTLQVSRHMNGTYALVLGVGAGVGIGAGVAGTNGVGAGVGAGAGVGTGVAVLVVDVVVVSGSRSSPPEGGGTVGITTLEQAKHVAQTAHPHLTNHGWPLSGQNSRHSLAT
jgi:hypothetical protein